MNYPKTNDEGVYLCMECEVPLPEYVPERCCSGHECGCYGLPIDPPLCAKCWDTVMAPKY